MSTKSKRVIGGGSVSKAAVWMIGLSVLLFWLPVLGPAIAGFVGGTEARTLGKAMTAALIPAVLVGLLVALLLSAFDLPVIGTVAGIGIGIAVLIQDIPMFIGAAFGAGTAKD